MPGPRSETTISIPVPRGEAGSALITPSPRPSVAYRTTLRASSDTAVAIRLWSTMPKPRSRATSRARWREATMSSSPAIGSRRSGTLPSGPGTVGAVPPQQCQSPLGVQRGAHATQLHAELDERDRDGRADADHDRLGAEEPGRRADLVEQARQERVDRLDHRHVEQDPPCTGALDLPREVLLQ